MTFIGKSFADTLKRLADPSSFLNEAVEPIDVDDPDVLEIGIIKSQKDHLVENYNRIQNLNKPIKATMNNKSDDIIE